MAAYKQSLDPHLNLEDAIYAATSLVDDIISGKISALAACASAFPYSEAEDIETCVEALCCAIDVFRRELEERQQPLAPKENLGHLQHERV